jgi:hypothetical protein
LPVSETSTVSSAENPQIPAQIISQNHSKKFSLSWIFFTASLLRPTNPKPTMSPPPNVPNSTPKQGQYLAFIYAYTHVLGRPPAEADLQQHFGVSPPSVHQMVLILERTGLIRRKPGVARSIEVLVAPELLPILR